jgi:hypothetical protein
MSLCVIGSSVCWRLIGCRCRQSLTKPECNRCGRQVQPVGLRRPRPSARHLELAKVEVVDIAAAGNTEADRLGASSRSQVSGKTGPFLAKALGVNSATSVESGRLQPQALSHPIRRAEPCAGRSACRRAVRPYLARTRRSSKRLRRALFSCAGAFEDDGLAAGAEAGSALRWRISA